MHKTLLLVLVYGKEKKSQQTREILCNMYFFYKSITSKCVDIVNNPIRIVIIIYFIHHDDYRHVHVLHIYYVCFAKEYVDFYVNFKMCCKFLVRLSCLEW